MAKDSFAYNLLFSSGRSLVTIVAQLIFTPIIVRIYDPMAYGSFGFIMSFSAICLPLFTLQYDRALFLAKDEDEIQALRAASNTFPLLLATLLFIIIWVAKDEILYYTNAENLGHGLFLVPVLIATGAIAQTSQRMVAVRYRYKEGFLYGGAMVLGSKLTAIAYGIFLGSHFFGLALAEALNKVLQHVINARYILKEKRLLDPRHFRLTGRLTVLRKYSGFPRFEVPAVAIAAASNHIPFLWIPAFFGLPAFGQYTLAVSLLEMPMRLVGYSLSGVFFQKAVRTFREKGAGELERITLRTMMSVIAASIVPLLLILFFARTVFIWLFGQEWAMAGSLSSILSIFYIARLIVEPISSVLRVIGEQKSYLGSHIFMLLLRMSAVAFAIANSELLEGSIWTYSLIGMVGYLSLGIYMIIRLKHHKHLAAMNKPDAPQ